MLTSGHLLPIIQQYVHLTLPGPSYFTHFHPPAPPPSPDIPSSKNPLFDRK